MGPQGALWEAEKGDQKGPTFLCVVQEAEYLYTQYTADIWAAFAVWSMSSTGMLMI